MITNACPDYVSNLLPSLASIVINITNTGRPYEWLKHPFQTKLDHNPFFPHTSPAALSTSTHSREFLSDY